MPRAKKSDMKVVSTPVRKKEDLQFEADQTRKDEMACGINGLLVVFVAVLSAVFLPEILYRYLFGSGQSNFDPQVLALVPTVAYAVAVLFSVYVLFANVVRKLKIRKLEKELQELK